MLDKVKIGAITYEVVFKSGLHDGNTALRGKIEPDEERIYIDPDQSELWQRLTFWHECLHGIADRAQIDLSEEVINVIADGIVDILLQEEVCSTASDVVYATTSSQLKRQCTTAPESLLSAVDKRLGVSTPPLR